MTAIQSDDVNPNGWKTTARFVNCFILHELQATCRKTTNELQATCQKTCREHVGLNEVWLRLERMKNINNEIAHLRSNGHKMPKVPPELDYVFVQRLVQEKIVAYLKHLTDQIFSGVLEPKTP